MPEIQEGYIPGALGRITEFHETYYAENWDLKYECFRENCVELAEFLGRYDDGSDRLWLVLSDPDDDGEQTIQGSIAIDGQPPEDEGARLRWFILAPEIHGQGLGRELMERAMSFCEAEDFDQVFLWTFEGLESAQHLYREYGFTLTEAYTSDDWGREVTHQRFDVRL
jgi:GNAT superfamily N-acetyltransferase